ncbi:MAG: GNAT family N-acetyltransferase [Chloroflexota bacterium]
MKTLSKSMEVKICAICHYRYVPAVVGDNELHRKYHDEFVHGVRVKTSKSDWVLEQLDDLKIILVSPTSPDTQRKRAQRIAFRVNRETHFDFVSYHASETDESESPLVFIGVTAERAVAFLVVRKNTHSAKVTWDLYDKKDRGTIPLHPDERWSISMVWILPTNRRKGIATNLINAASRYLKVPVLDMACTNPFTEFGYPLAKTISPINVILSR